MIRVVVEDRNRSFNRLAQTLGPRKMAIVNTRAINVAIQKANTGYRRLIVGQYNLKYADTKNMSVPKRATYTIQQGTISGDLSPISLSRFNPTFYDTVRGKVTTLTKNKNKEGKPLEQSTRSENENDLYGGVTISIKRGEQKRIPFAFMTESSKNAGISMQVWARGGYKNNTFEVGKKRLPITPLKTVSPYGALTNAEVAKKTEVDATKNMHAEFERQVNLIIDQGNQ